MTSGFTEKLERAFGLRLDAEQRRRVALYLEQLEKWRWRIRLTAIEDPRDLLQFHFFEAFWAADTFLSGCHGLADIGSGAGFPGLAIKIRRPELPVTLLEKNSRKTAFLKDVSRRLQLPVRVSGGPAEGFGGWPEIDMASLRALKPSVELIRQLKAHRIRLLWFHGSAATPAFPGFQPVARQKVPLSDQRWISLLEPDGFT